MGEVYEAQQLNPQRRVALKVLAPWLAQDEEALQRFWREAEVQGQLDHPGIVHIISTGKTAEGTAFYAMQLVQGISLAHLIRLATEGQPATASLDPTGGPGPADTPGGMRCLTQGQPQPPAEPPVEVVREYLGDRFRCVARIGLLAARVLDYAHGQGHLHRDIKPSNLMVDHLGQVRLLDFGLTRALDPDAQASCPGAVRGTPWYMSPEQAKGEPVDQRCDIYALGVSLYELATAGVGPFTASRENAAAVLAQARAGAHLPLRLLAPDIPRRLEHAILRAMRPKAQRRYGSAEELAADLEHFLSSAAPPSTGSWWPAARRWSRGWWLRAGALALVLGLLLAVGSYVARHSSQPSPKPATDPPTPHAPVAWPKDYPPQLIDRPTGQPVELIWPKRDRSEPGIGENPARGQVHLDPPLPPDRDFRFLPTWCRRLSGEGKYFAHPDELRLVSGPQRGAGCTILALDNDLAGRWFEFEIALQQPAREEVAKHQVGVFFGWQETAPEMARAYFVQLDERPLPDLGRPYGQIIVGQAMIRTRQEAKGGPGMVVPLCPFPGNLLHVIPLTQTKDHWHHLHVRAVRGHVTVLVDQGRGIEFAPPFDPRGALGIWVQEGEGQFGKASIKAIEPEATDK
jgi:hypothetical protein